ncbi:hypothetical protein [Halomonas salinarum]|uniref:hypothetical protein n=1 Tax=Halomonas salinarum TaxID=1158993 RepID=UPI00143B970D|nr:hypothetical protein [Halomonas salinarum]
MSQDSYPIEEGDRVDHRLFGFGTVVGEPIRSVSVEDYRYKRGPRDTQQQQWSIQVRWDDPERPDSAIAFKNKFVGMILKGLTLPLPSKTMVPSSVRCRLPILAPSPIGTASGSHFYRLGYLPAERLSK